MTDETVELDPAEIDRFARAIARIVERDHALDSEDFSLLSNSYGTAFQFLVMRRGSEYALRLARAVEARALEILDVTSHDAVGVAFGGLHDRVSRENEKLD